MHTCKTLIICHANACVCDKICNTVRDILYDLKCDIVCEIKIM